MSRIYVCDRCGAKFGTWVTICVELPASSFFGKKGKKVNVELCETCLASARRLFKTFMDNGPREASNNPCKVLVASSF